MPEVTEPEVILYLGNSFEQWGAAIGAAVVSLAAMYLIRAWGLKKLQKIIQGIALDWPHFVIESLKQTKFLILLLVAIYVGSLSLSLPDNAEAILQKIAVVGFVLQVGLWIINVYNAWFTKFSSEQTQASPSVVTSMRLLGFAVKSIVWLLIGLMALDNFGVDITALIAGLGIGGIAIAMAVKNILSDIFASLTIVLDKPFEEGEAIKIGDMIGPVEEIGLKTTRIRSLNGEELIIPNSDLLNNRLHNFSRLKERRVTFTLGVTYDTPRKKLQKIPQIVQKAIEAHEELRFGRCHFTEYGAYSLNFAGLYHVLSPDYNLYMDLQQKVLFTIHEKFEKEGIEFAFPTQTINLETNDTAKAEKKAA